MRAYDVRRLGEMRIQPRSIITLKTPAPFPGKYPTRIRWILLPFSHTEKAIIYSGKPSKWATNEFIKLLNKHQSTVRFGVAYYWEFDRKNLIAFGTLAIPTSWSEQLRLRNEDPARTLVKNVSVQQPLYTLYHPNSCYPEYAPWDWVNGGNKTTKIKIEGKDFTVYSSAPRGAALLDHARWWSSHFPAGVTG